MTYFFQKWPIRHQLITGFIFCTSLLVLVQYLTVLGTVFTVAQLTVDESTAGLDTQIQNHLLISSVETASIISKRFQNVEANIINPLALALQAAADESIPLAHNSITGYPYAPAHKDYRCWDVPDSTAQGTCWYYSSDTDYKAQITNSEDIKMVEKSALLDRWVDKQAALTKANVSGDVYLIYMGIEMQQDPSRAFWRVSRSFSPTMKNTNPGKAGSLYTCVEGSNAQRVRGSVCYNPAARGWYTGAKSAKLAKDDLLGHTILSSPYVGAGDNMLMVTMSKAVYSKKSKKLLGVVAVDLELKQVNKLINTVNILDSGFSTLVTQDGSVVADPHVKLRSDSPVPKAWMLETGIAKSETEWTTLVNENLEVDAIMRYSSPKYGTMFMAWTFLYPLLPVTGAGSSTPNTWYVLTSIPENVAHGPIVEMKTKTKDSTGVILSMTAVVSFGVLLVVNVVIVWQARQVTRPIEAMTAAAKSIVSNADAEDIFKNINEDNLKGENDEIGELVKEFKEMISGLSKRGEAATAKGMQEARGFPNNPSFMQNSNEDAASAPNLPVAAVAVSGSQTVNI